MTEGHTHKLGPDVEYVGTSGFSHVFRGSCSGCDAILRGYSISRNPNDIEQLEEE